MKCPNGGKVCYKSEELAKEARKTILYKRKDMNHISGSRIYNCPACKYYHLTTTGY